MTFELLTQSHKNWTAMRDYAYNCSWRAGKALATMMDTNAFSDWEGIIVALDNDKICGYCTVTKTDCIPDIPYTPYIGYLFVNEDYRGHRTSEKLIDYATLYLRSVDFDKVYLISDHENLYEKYDFEVIDRKIAPWGAEEKIYTKQLSQL